MKFVQLMCFLGRVLIFVSSACLQMLGCDFSDFDHYQSKFSMEEIHWRLHSFLIKNIEISRYCTLTRDALYFGDLEQGKIDYILSLTDSGTTATFKKKHDNFNDLRVAIDPGHFGGAYAELEERYVTIPSTQTRNHQPIHFHEGDLTYFTALELARLLRKDGVIVYITRPGIGQGAIKEDFFSWVATHDISPTHASLSQIFRCEYNVEDLKERAKCINAFHPDLTIVIHYNAHVTDEEKQKKTRVSQSNYNLAFVPGAFCIGELCQERDRYEFLRLLLSDDVEESIKLSESITQQFTKYLRVPSISMDEKTSYTDRACLIQRPGIYSRNLVLTRFVHGPICYGETLIQNHEQEIYNLSDWSDSVDGMACPRRIKEVANAYFRGIQEYFFGD